MRNEEPELALGQGFTRVDGGRAQWVAAHVWLMPGAFYLSVCVCVDECVLAFDLSVCVCVCACVCVCNAELGTIQRE